MIKIAPSILSADFSSLKTELEKIERSGADMVHLDIMDGHFVPPITIGAIVVNALRPHSKLLFDTHLMVSNPDSHIESLLKPDPTALQSMLRLRQTLKHPWPESGASVRGK